MHTSREVWKLRGLYFFFFAGLGTVAPYLPLLLQAAGFRPAAVGLLLSASPLVAGAAPAALGALADRAGRTLPFLRALLAALPLTVFFLFHAVTFGQFLGLLILWSAAFSPFPPLADHITLEYTKRRGVDYGRVRVFGSIGFALANAAVSVFLLRFRARQLDFVYAPLLAAALLLSTRIRELPGEQAAGPPSWRFLRDLRPLAGFYALVFILTVTFPAFYTFFPLYMGGGGMPRNAVPFAFMLSSGSEIFTMPVASKAYRKLGPGGMLSLSAASYAARWLTLGLSPWPPLDIAIQALHGVSFGFFYTAAVSYIRDRAGPESRATGQGAFGAVTAAGGVVGNVLGGWLFQEAGKGMFFAAAALAGTAAVLFTRLGRSRGGAGVTP